MASLAPPERSPRSFHATFAGPVAPGPAELRAAVLAEGRSASHAEARITQGGVARVVATATFGLARPSALDLRPEPCPVPPLSDAMPEMPYLPGVTPTFTQHVAYRYAGAFPYTGADRPALGGYVRPRGSRPDRLDGAWVLALLDAWPPPAITALTAPAPASTATLSALLTLPEDPLPADAWYAFSSHATWIGGGWADLQARLWAPDGRLVAQMTQLTAIFG